MDKYRIKTLEQLRQVIPSNEKHQQIVRDQRFDTVEAGERLFIADSPLVFFATANADGHVDVAPRGGNPGFVKCQDEKNLLFPELRGNHDARNLRNILQNNQVGLVFLVPKRPEVMRITGWASITADPELLELLKDTGMPPKLCIKIEIKECFLHCGRALNLSHLWRPENWAEPNKKFRKRIRKKSGKVDLLDCLLYTSPSPRDQRGSRMPSSA